VQSLTHSPIVRNAWERGQKLDIHGWIYRLTDGRLRDLECASVPPSRADLFDDIHAVMPGQPSQSL
jgi:carbonic anhydrase